MFGKVKVRAAAFNKVFPETPELSMNPSYRLPTKSHAPPHIRREVDRIGLLLSDGHPAAW